MGHHTAAVLNRDLALVVLKEDPVLIQLLDFAVNFPSWLISRMTFRWSVLKMICGSRLLPMDPPTLVPKLPKRRAARNRPERSVAGLTGRRARRAADGSRPRVCRGRRLQPMPICAPFGLFRSYKPFPCTMLAMEGQNMVTSAERMRAVRERQRRVI